MKTITPEMQHAHLDRLKKAFDLVADPKDWRAPIYAVVLTESRETAGVTVDEIADAIVHYTGTVPQVHVLTVPTGAVLFKATGYRAGPCGP